MFFFVWTSLASAHGIVDTDLPIVEGIVTCLDKQESAERLECYESLCPPDLNCAKSLLVAATEAGGPPKGIGLLHDLMDAHETYGITSDGHELAHIVGRQAAKHFGLSGEVFLQCPRDFFYGCGHGFFEIALALADSQSGAAVEVCGTLPVGQRFVCYHGVGHGLMMSHGDRMQESLDVCNQLPKAEIADQGCWQGVFMENVNTFIRGEALKGVFKANDPLAPCDHMDRKYDRECYLNQAAVLVMSAKNSIAKASKYCLKAGPTGIGPCMEGLGQFATNPGWQESLTGQKYSDEAFLDAAVDLCQQFPTEYVSLCETAAAGNLINYDSADKAVAFCRLVGEENADVCYRKIVMEIRRPLITPEVRSSVCAALPATYTSLCAPAVAAASSRSTTPSAAKPSSSSSFVWNVFARLLSAPFRFLVSISSGTHPPSSASSSVPDIPSIMTDEPSGQTVVHYRDGAFVPSLLSISVGETVLWINDGDDYLWPASDHHPTHELYPAFDAKRAVTQAKPWSFTFEKRGRWTFHNHLSPDATGTIVVE